MKFRLNAITSDIVISLYVIASLYFRFKFESQVQISPLNSIILGASFVLLIWSLIKLKILNPGWFGLFNSKKNK